MSLLINRYSSRNNVKPSDKSGFNDDNYVYMTSIKISYHSTKDTRKKIKETNKNNKIRHLLILPLIHFEWFIYITYYYTT